MKCGTDAPAESRRDDRDYRASRRKCDREPRMPCWRSARSNRHSLRRSSRRRSHHPSPSICRTPPECYAPTGRSSFPTRALHRCNCDAVLHLGNAGSHPRSARRLLPLRPRAHRSLERHLGAIGFDDDAIRVDLGIALEGLLDLLLHLGWGDMGLDLHEIADSLHALDGPNGALSALALIVPLDLAFEGKVSILRDDPYLLPGIGKLGLDCRDRVTRDLGIGPIVDRRQAHLDVVRKTRDAGHAPGRVLGFPLLHEALRESRHAHDAL